MGIEDELQGIFLEEGREHVTSLENDLLELESQTEVDPELVNRVFRSAHTIKGGSSSLGFELLTGFTHTMENVLDRVRRNSLPVSPELISLLLSCVDWIGRMLDAIEHREAEPEAAETDGLIARLNGYLEETVDSATRQADRATGANPDAAENDPDAPSGTRFDIAIKLADNAMAEGADPLLLLVELDALSDRARMTVEAVHHDALPPLAEMDPERLYLWWEVAVTGPIDRDEIDDVFIFVDGDSDIAVTESDPASTRAATVADRPPEAARESAGKADPSDKQAAPEPPGQSVTKSPAKAVTSIRVDTDRLDRLVNLVGELVIGQARVAQVVDTPSPEAVAAIEALERITRDLQSEAMGMRMLPIGPTFAQFQRVVRDLAMAQDKRIELQIDGKQTELDKNIIEKIGDPLKHMVRNAVDHGIETPQQRRLAGKPEVGTMTLSAYHQAGNIVIEITDDGKGLDAKAIAAKAIREGVIPENHSLSDQQLFGLIFHPGLSTAEQVTDVSGRGVGMDVVKRNIESLRGRIDIDSTPGKGTTFQIHLPLTLAIIEGMAISVAGQIYLVPLLSITESIHPDPDDFESVSGRNEWVTLRGEALPLIRLDELLGLPPGEETDQLVIVVESAGRRYGLLVDDILGQQQVVIKPIEQNYRQVDGVAGASVLVGGQVAMVLDVGGLVRQAFIESRVG